MLLIEVKAISILEYSFFHHIRRQPFPMPKRWNINSHVRKVPKKSGFLLFRKFSDDENVIVLFASSSVYKLTSGPWSDDGYAAFSSQYKAMI